MYRCDYHWCFCLQSLVLYGLYPHVLENLEGFLEDVVYALHIVRRGGKWQLECVIVVDTGVRVHVWGVVPAGSAWKETLLGHLASVMACFRNPSVPHAIVCSGDRAVGSSIAAVFEGHVPAVMPVIDESWLLLAVQKEMIDKFNGVEPIGFVEFLRLRLQCAIHDPLMERMPQLSRVIRGAPLNLVLVSQVLKELLLCWSDVISYFMTSRSGTEEGTLTFQSVERGVVDDRMLRGRLAVCSFLLDLGMYEHFSSRRTRSVTSSILTTVPSTPLATRG